MKDSLRVILPSRLKYQFRGIADEGSLLNHIDSSELTHMCRFKGSLELRLVDAFSSISNRFRIIQWHVHGFSSQFYRVPNVCRLLCILRSKWSIPASGSAAILRP